MKLVGAETVIPCVDAEKPTKAASLTLSPRSTGADSTGVLGRLAA